MNGVVARALLRLYPRAFRAEFGTDLLATHAAAVARKRADGRLALWSFCLREWWSLVRGAFQERRESAPQRGRRLRPGDGFRQDVRFALRGFRRRPLFAGAVVCTVGLGIGANAAVFSMLKAVLLDPLPVADPGTLVVVYEALERDPFGATSWPTYLELREDLRSLTDLAVSAELDVGLRAGEVSDRVVAGAVSGNWFRVLGLRPGLGRLLRPSDVTGQGTATAVLSEALWRRRFAADPEVIGSTIQLSGQPFTVVGVAPEGFRGTDLAVAHDLWIPVTRMRSVGGDGLFGDEILTTRFLPFLRMVGRLRPGVAPAAVAAELNARHAVLRQANGAAMDMPFADPTIRAVPIRRAATAESRSDLVRFLAVPAVVAFLTLAIACLNVALLLVVRASERRREFGVRSALGAGRPRIVRQVLTESVLLGLAGCLVGFAVARVTIALLRRFPLPGGIAMDTLDLTLDTRVLAFGLGSALGTALLFGAVPAWVAARSDISVHLRSRTEAGATIRFGLLAGQVALCLALLVGAGLFTRSLRAALHHDPGFDPTGVAAASFSAGPHGYTAETAPAFFQELLDALAAAPGVRSAALGVHVPIEPRRLRMPVSNEVVHGPGEGRIRAGTAPLSVDVVAGEWFGTLRIPLLRGRAFGPSDGPDAPLVAVLSRSAAGTLWPGEDPLGRMFQLVRGVGAGFTVIGIVEDITAHSVQEARVPYVYVSALQNPRVQALGNVSLIARDTGDGSVALDAIRGVLARHAPTLPVFRTRLVERQIDAVLVPQRLGSTLLGVFGILSLLVAAVGIYAVIAFAVVQRRFEIGVRRALGARTADILRDVGARTLAAVLAGGAVGVLAAATLTRFVTVYLYGIDAADPVTWLGAAAVLLATASLATLLPARDAARVSPLDAIRPNG